MKAEEKKQARSKQLRAVVRDLLLPHIYSRGFQDDTREVFKRKPGGHLRHGFTRWNGETLELLEIQYDRHSRAKFVVNLGIVPPVGIDYCGYHYAQQEADVSIAKPARLYAGRSWRMRWFGFPLLRVPLLRNPSAEDIVNVAIRMFPQVEAWLRDGVKGPNIGIMGVPGERRSTRSKGG